MATRRNTAPVRNDVTAREIITAIASTHTFHLPAKIEDILNRNIPSRNPRCASRNGRGAARTGDKATAIEAANLVNVTKQQSKILRAMILIDRPVVVNVIAERSGVLLSSASTRMKELVRSGLVSEVGTGKFNNRNKTTYAISTPGREYVATEASRVN